MRQEQQQLETSLVQHAWLSLNSKSIVGDRPFVLLCRLPQVELWQAVTMAPAAAGYFRTLVLNGVEEHSEVLWNYFLSAHFLLMLGASEDAFRRRM